jgi:hypothetical protein
MKWEKIKMNMKIVELLKKANDKDRPEMAALVAANGLWEEIKEAGGASLIREAAVYIEQHPAFSADTTPPKDSRAMDMVIEAAKGGKAELERLVLRAEIERRKKQG